MFFCSFQPSAVMLTNMWTL